MQQELVPDFNEPTISCLALHRQWEQILVQTETLLATLNADSNSWSESTLVTLRELSRFYAHHLRAHLQFEEQHLFPALLRTSMKLADSVYRLQQQHKTLQVLWLTLEKPLNHPASIPDVSAFKSTLSNWIINSRTLIKNEEEEFYDLAQHLLSQDQLCKLGQKLKALYQTGSV